MFRLLRAIVRARSLLLRKSHRDRTDRQQHEIDAALAGLQEHRRRQRPADDEMPGAQTAADRRCHVGDMADDVDHFADVGLEVRGDGNILAAAGDPALESVETSTAAHRVAWPKNHMTLEDVAGERGLYVVHRR